MMQMLAIALNTFREAIRNRLFAAMLLMTVGMLIVVAAFSSASLHEEVRLMKDMGLFLTSTLSVVIAIFVGVNLVYKEIERKTIYTVAPKPIHRSQFLMGKFLGLAFTLAVQVLFLGAALAAVYGAVTSQASDTVYFILILLGWAVLDFLLVAVGARPFEPGMHGDTSRRADLARRALALLAGLGLVVYTAVVLPPEMLQALFLVYVEVMVITAIALVFSSFSSPFLSGFLTFGVFILGRFADRLATLDLSEPGEQLDPLLERVQSLVHGVATVVPDLTLYNLTPYVVYGHPVGAGYVLQATLYGATYAGLALLLAALMFSRRDFV
ncbi:MAG: ABC transporter permease [Myxococcales bacterium]|nr:ABC transporter permease [Myxococcales bacterium]MCB9546736.1 ABC transporter permease [Myxococcales bacterium]